MRRTNEDTVTFLFTDIEGSTQTLRHLGLRYIDALEDHRRLLRRVASDFGGSEVDAVGDSLLFAFDNAKAAAAAAVFGQLALAALGDEICRVRMAIHTGPVWRRRRRYYGLTLHKVARIAGLSHGGQVLMSADAAASLSTTVAVRRVGTGILDGFDHPEEIYELSLASISAAAGSPR